MELAPGTPEAEAEGCTCGEQSEAAEQGFYVFAEGCPLHWDAVKPQ